MTRHGCGLVGAAIIAALSLVCGAASGATTYPDRARDVVPGTGPNIVSVTVSNTPTKVKFSVRFLKAPPLRINVREGWVDMLLIGVDTPPLGTAPFPGGEWPGANFALGTHGPSKTGQMVRLGQGIPATSRLVATFGIVTSGSTVTFSIPRHAFGNPRWFAFEVAAAREAQAENEAGPAPDFAPSTGTFHYSFSG
jgi:hypothetical protein